MQVLHAIAAIRNPVFDFIFSLITHIGEETVFLVLALLFFWCVNKREGYYILITGLIGTVINQFAKLLFKIPRPWVKDPNFEIVESARAEATGYSFPSGHTQNTAGTFGSIGRFNKQLWIRITSIVIIALVAFSRMYLGVHTPLDVVVSLGIAAILVFAFYPMFKSDERMEKCMPFIIIGSVLISVGLALYVFLMPREGVDPHNLESGMKNAATLLGCTIALIPVYFIDKKYTNFVTNGKWYAQVFKLLGGLCGVLIIKSALKVPLNFICGNEYVGRGLRYFLIVVFAGLVWPLTFKFFSGLRIKWLDGLFSKKEQ